MCCAVLVPCISASFFFFFFNDTATTEIYTLSLHDALPILVDLIAGLEVALDFPEEQIGHDCPPARATVTRLRDEVQRWLTSADRKSTRLNSSHLVISYAVFCLKKKKNT